MSSVVAHKTMSHGTIVSRRTWLDLSLDWAERAVVLALYGWLVARLISAAAASGNLANLILLPSEGLVVVFMLIRRTATEVSLRPADWLVAAVAMTTPLLVQPASGSALLSPSAGAALLLMGLLVQVHAKLVLGRSLGCVPANRGLKFSGPYGYVRHPMYAGYLLSHLAFLLMNATWWNLVVYLLCYAAQIPRLLAEERLLRRDPRYAQYMAAVRYRLLPGVF